MNASLICLLICLSIIFFQDWNYRRIHIALPFIIFGVSIYLILDKVFLKNIVYNLSFFLISLSAMTFYMSIKSKQFLNPFKNYFGLGDLLFYVAVSPLFLLQNYILYFILSMIFAIVLQTGLKKIIKEDTVPLAGFSSLLLFILIVKDMVFDFQKITLL